MENYTNLHYSAEVQQTHTSPTYEDEYVPAREVRATWERMHASRNVTNSLLAFLCGLQLFLVIKEIFL